MKATLFIRADAGPAMGTGHFMRMLALAEGWVKTGGAVVFGGDVTPALIPRTAALGARFVALEKGANDAGWTVSHARLSKASVVVADGYDFGSAWQREIREAGLALLVVDDNGENGAYDANWVLNVNAHANDTMYVNRSAACTMLLGTKFMLLRDSIRKHPQARAPVSVAQRVLVTFGGSDPADATGLVLNALAGLSGTREVRVMVGAANRRVTHYEALGAQLPNLKVLVDVDDVAPVMAWADVAVCAPATTCWELASLGVPAMTLTLADNQQRIGETMNALGATRSLGDARRPLNAATLTAAMQSFFESQSARAEVVRVASALFDGRGVDRVVEALSAGPSKSS